MDNFELYRDISMRTGGDIYLGVVGPVRTGKSTFIKRFMDLMVLPNMMDSPAKKRAIDELPLSAPGNTVTTTEPKFIPKDAASIRLNDEITANIRLIDCVGFMVKGADAGEPALQKEERMVKTPWFDYEIPFSKAAELGTHKVISEHSTIGIVVTTDGSFGDLSRDQFVVPEQRTIEELKKSNKPFVVLLNSEKPLSEETQSLASRLAKEYGVSVLPINCSQMRTDDIHRMLEAVLLEFPIMKFEFFMPKWVEMLDSTHPIKESLLAMLSHFFETYQKVRDIYNVVPATESPFISRLRVETMDLSTGGVRMELEFFEMYYYQIMSELCGVTIEGEYQLIQMIRELSMMKLEYEKVQQAVDSVRDHGYGVVLPARDEIGVEDPTIIKHGNKYGVKIKANSPSIHMIRADIETEIAPIVGNEQQANDLINFIKENQNTEGGIWNTNIFGKSVEQLIEDGIRNKLNLMGEECQIKLQDTMKKIVNESNGGMVCIII